MAEAIRDPADPEITGHAATAAYYVAGTRVSLVSIVQFLRDGLSPEAIVEELDTLTLAQVFGAITFYLENQPAIDAYRVRQKQRFDAARSSATPVSASRRERLDAARDQLRSGASTR